MPPQVTFSRTVARMFLGILIVGFSIAALSLLGLGLATIDPFGAIFELPFLPLWLWEGAFPAVLLAFVLGASLVCAIVFYKRGLFERSILITIVGLILAAPLLPESVYLWHITTTQGVNISVIPSSADLATFKRLPVHIYFVDVNHVYCWSNGINVIPGADPSTAKAVIGPRDSTGDTYLQVTVGGVVQKYDYQCNIMQ